MLGWKGGHNICRHGCTHAYRYMHIFGATHVRMHVRACACMGLRDAGWDLNFGMICRAPHRRRVLEIWHMLTETATNRSRKRPEPLNSIHGGCFLVISRDYALLLRPLGEFCWISDTKSVQNGGPKLYKCRSNIDIVLRLPFFTPMGGQSEQNYGNFPIKWEVFTVKCEPT